VWWWHGGKRPSITLVRVASPSSVSPAGPRSGASSSWRHLLLPWGLLLWGPMFVFLDIPRGYGGWSFTFMCSTSPFLLPLSRLRTCSSIALLNTQSKVKSRHFSLWCGLCLLEYSFCSCFAWICGSLEANHWGKCWIGSDLLFIVLNPWYVVLDLW
jgi:hypothetical protein